MYDVYRNSISMFYIRRSWQNYKNFNYRISIPMKNLRMKSHRKRWKCRFSRRKFIFRRILCKFRPLDLISILKTFIFNAPGNAGRPAQTQNPEILNLIFWDYFRDYANFDNVYPWNILFDHNILKLDFLCFFHKSRWF